MKKSHIIVYIISALLMGVSYLYFILAYKEPPITFYMHSYHLAGFAYILVPILFELIFKKELQLDVLIGYMIFIFASQIFGSAYNGYGKVPILDSLVHAFSAFIVVLFIASLSSKLVERSSFLEKLVYLVGFGMIVGVLWEIVEFCGDSWFGMNNQIYRYGENPYIGQEALKDTMVDFICDLIGSTIGAIFIIIKPLIKKRKEQKMA